jgi:hypothetical protein
MTITYNPNANKQSTTFSGTSAALTIASVTAGNTLLCAVQWADSAGTTGLAAPATVTDSTGQTWTAEVVQATGGAATSGIGALIYRLFNANAGSHTVTFTPSGGTSPYIGDMALFEVTPLALDKHPAAVNSTSGTGITGPNTGTLTNAIEFALSVCGIDAGSGSINTPTGFTSIQNSGDGSINFQITSTTTALNPAYTSTGGDSAQAAIATYTDASGAGTPPFMTNPGASFSSNRLRQFSGAITFGTAAVLMPVNPLPLPLQNNDASAVLQQHHPQRIRGFQNADTSRGTPKTLTADAIERVRDYPFWVLDARSVVKRVSDTSQGTNPGLLPPTAAARPFTPTVQPELPRLLWQPGDTSQGVPKTTYPDAVTEPAGQEDYCTMVPARLHVNVNTAQGTPLTLLFSANPFTPAPHYAPARYAWQPGDTSQSSPKATYPDNTSPLNVVWGGGIERPPATVDVSRGTNIGLLPPLVPLPVGLNASFISVQRFWWQPADTSGVAAPLYAVVVVGTPVINAPGFGPQYRWHQEDTTQSTPKTLSTDAQLPVQNYQHTAPDRVRPVVDTSQGTPKALTIDATLPFQNYQHTAPDRVRPVVDTTTFQPKTLYADAIYPFVPAPHLAPLRVWWQPADTSQSVPKVTYGDATAPAFNPPQFLQDRVRPVADTSQSTPAALQVVLPVVQNVLYPTQDPVRVVVDTSHGTPKTLTSDATTPFTPPPSFAPVRFYYQPPDTSQAWASIYAPVTPPPASTAPSAERRIRQQQEHGALPQNKWVAEQRRKFIDYWLNKDKDDDDDDDSLLLM